jgi:ribose-phosphate pyrophosphokinase
LARSQTVGGARWNSRIKKNTGNTFGKSYISIEKDRDLETGDIKMSGIQGEKPKNTVCIIDDMISSGGTMVQAINAYHEAGVENIYAFATHPVFSAEAPERLQNSPVKKVFVTDSIAIDEAKQFEKLEIISVAHLFAEAVKS